MSNTDRLSNSDGNSTDVSDFAPLWDFLDREAMWSILERLPELLQSPGEPSYEEVRLSVSLASANWLVFGVIDEDNIIVLGSGSNPIEALKKAFDIVE